MIEKALLFILWFFIWTLLSWPPDGHDIISGICVSLFVTFMTVDTFKASMKRKFSVKKILWFKVYALVFLWECLKANIDVAWRVAHPMLPIRPGTLKIKTTLKTDIGLTFLANSITLTPGTTTVDIDKEGGFIYIHMLCLKEGMPSADMRLPVVDKFERILKRIFG